MEILKLLSFPRFLILGGISLFRQEMYPNSYRENLLKHAYLAITKTYLFIFNKSPQRPKLVLEMKIG